MKKLILEKSDGEQVIYEPREGVFQTSALILWDDSVDGPLPELPLGALVRDGAELKVDPVKQAAHDAKERAKAAAEAEKAAKKAKLRTDLAKVKDKDTQDVLKGLLDELGL